jgi:hypothetical protein
MVSVRNPARFEARRIERRSHAFQAWADGGDAFLRVEGVGLILMRCAVV